jgi:hypothetical protein
LITQREITTHISRTNDGQVRLRLVHKETGKEAVGVGTYEESKNYCLNSLEHQLGDEIERGPNDAA